MPPPRCTLGPVRRHPPPLALLWAAVALLAAAAGVQEPPPATCEPLDGDCPDDCAAAGFAGSLNYTAKIWVSPYHGGIQRVASAAEEYIAAQGKVRGLDSPLTGLHTTLFYFCCHTAGEKAAVLEALRGMAWGAFPLRYDSFACNLDHDGETVYLHAMPSEQVALSRLARSIQRAALAAGVPAPPRRTLFHMTLARVGYDYPTDAVVEYFLGKGAGDRSGGGGRGGGGGGGKEARGLQRPNIASKSGGELRDKEPKEGGGEGGGAHHPKEAPEGGGGGGEAWDFGVLVVDRFSIEGEVFAAGGLGALGA